MRNESIVLIDTLSARRCNEIEKFPTIFSMGRLFKKTHIVINFVPLIEVFRLANFYKAFSLKPRGRHLITVCEGTACHVQGSPRVVEEVLLQLDVQRGETTKDGAFTVETVNCVGACALAPVVIVDGVYHDHMTPAKLRDLLETIRQQDQEVASYA